MQKAERIPSHLFRTDMWILIYPQEACSAHSNSVCTYSVIRLCILVMKFQKSTTYSSSIDYEGTGCGIITICIDKNMRQWRRPEVPSLLPTLLRRKTAPFDCSVLARTTTFRFECCAGRFPYKQGKKKAAQETPMDLFSDQPRSKMCFSKTEPFQ